MEKQKQTAKPKETPEQRPDLWIGGTYGNIWLQRRSDYVMVKAGSSRIASIHGAIQKARIGLVTNGDLTGYKYTGPIDDEMMANILIYG